MQVLDRNVSRILNILLQSPHFKGYKYSNKPDLESHAVTARSAASEGMILLKNEDNALPLPGNIKNIAVFGNTSYDLISGGTGSGDVNEAYTVSLVEGLRKAGYTISEGLEKLYSSYLDFAKVGRPSRTGIMMFMGQEPIEEIVINKDVIKGAVATSEAAIITIGRNSGEGRDRLNKPGDFLLTDTEQQLIKNVSEAYKSKGKKVIVILNIGGVIETASWKDLPDAILLSWQGGQEAGNSIAEILKGKVNPSGKLTMTFPVKYEDVPSAKTFPGSELTESKPSPDTPVNAFQRVKPAIVYYEDGIYVGYRYYETFNVQPSYEFGYGLSYSAFDYSNLKLSSATFSKNITVTVDISNKGSFPGKEAVQLYISAPKTELDKPAEELRAFAKTKLLQPGEKQTLSLIIDRQALASFDSGTSSWIADGGTYEVRVGASSKDIRQKATFSLPRDLIVKKESKSLAPKDKINELKPADR
jgi:beta-glucosidase